MGDARRRQQLLGLSTFVHFRDSTKAGGKRRHPCFRIWRSSGARPSADFINRTGLADPSIDCIAAKARLKILATLTSGPSMLRPLVWNRGRPSGLCKCARTWGRWLARQQGMTRWTSCAAQLAGRQMHNGTQLCASFSETHRVLIRRGMPTRSRTTSSITCTGWRGTGGEMRQVMSVKALLCHQRMKPIRFLDEDGVCGACGTNFTGSLCLLDHLQLAETALQRRVSQGCRNSPWSKLWNSMHWKGLLALLQGTRA